MHSELSDEQYRLLQTFNDLAAGDIPGVRTALTGRSPSIL